MSHRNRNWFMAVGLLLAAVSSGCGPSAPKLYPVSGVVTFEGQPVEGASVVFIPQAGRPSMALTDASGKYVITTSGKPGAPTGTYSVTISKQSGGGGDAVPPVMPQSTGGAPTEEDLKKMQEQQKQMAEKMRAATKEKPKSLIPAKYALPEGSGLSREVTTDASKNIFDFELTP